jgi:hypothetical protein
MIMETVAVSLKAIIGHSLDSHSKTHKCHYRQGCQERVRVPVKNKIFTHFRKDWLLFAE